MAWDPGALNTEHPLSLHLGLPHYQPAALNKLRNSAMLSNSHIHTLDIYSRMRIKFENCISY